MTGVVGIGAACLMLAGQVVEAAAEALPTVRVTGADDDQPLPGASLHLVVDGERHDAETDDAGRFADWPAAAERSLQVTARHAGRVPVRAVVTMPYDGDDELVLRLPAGQTIGGIVRNEAGEPLPEARVAITARGRTDDGHAIDLRRATVQTDEAGRWQFHEAPARGAMLWLTVDHPNHHATGERRADADTLAALYEQNADIALQQAIVLAGQVVDSDGEPVANARVAHGPAICGTPAGETRTDDDGRFRLAFHKPTRVPVTIQVSGHAPMMREVSLNGEESEQTFTLTAGTPLRGRVVDADGEPIADVDVRLQGMGRASGSSVASWNGRTDEDGRFEWPHAPDEELRISFSKTGYTRLPFRQIRPGEQEHTITLHRAPRITGKVIDAETGEPIESFTVVPGLVWHHQPPPPPLWERQRATEHTDGTFEQTFTRGDADHAVRIEAPGYQAAISPTWGVDDGEQTHTFELTPATPVAGQVLTPDGEPAADAQVRLVAEGQQLQINMPAMRVHGMGTFDTTADEEGHFELPSEPGTFSVMVLHDAGYTQLDELTAETAGEQLDAITLKPWARLEGRLMRSGEPLADETVRLHLQQHFDPQSGPRIFWNASAESDAEGRFTFDRLPEGDAGVGRVHDLGGGMSTTLNMERLTLEAGQVHDVQIGGTGRPVVGRLLLPDDVAERMEPQISGVTIMTHIEQEQPPFPDDWGEMSPEDRRAWQEAWLASDEGIAFHERMQEQARERRHFRALLEPDGRFRTDDVPPGEYQLNFHAQSRDGDRLGTAGRTFTVGPIEGGVTDEPLDLGELAVTAVATLSVGEEAPLFDIEDLDGNPVRLADYRGRFVLLDFWATWCGPCIAETPNLKRVYDAFGDDDRFELIALSLDQDRDAPRRYAEDNDLAWVQGFLGEWSDTDLPEQYAVQGIPQIMLIGPDGKVVARNLRGENIYRTVADALQAHREP